MSAAHPGMSCYKNRDSKDQEIYKGIVWNVDTDMSGKELKLELELPLSGKDDSNVLITQLVDEEVCNPLKVWHDLGEHANPSEQEVELLRQAAQPFTQTKRCGNKVSLVLKDNAVCYFEVKAAPINSDRGYIYGRQS